MTVDEANKLVDEFALAVELLTLARSAGKGADPKVKADRAEKVKETRKKLVLELIASEM